MKFNGFPKQSLKFWRELPANNDKVWFDEHKAVYDNHVLEPARQFVMAMGRKLKEISPGVTADPRINKSLFKIHRDTRFSQDKTPFKTHMGIMFWEGSRKRMECSCYYFHLEPPELMLAAGLHIFPKSHIAAFRESVVHPKHGPALHAIITEATGKHGFWLDGKHYKKTPRGFDPDHKYAPYLLHNGLAIGVHDKIPQAFFSADLIDYCLDRYKKMAPLHHWLVAMTERVQ